MYYVYLLESKRTRRFYVGSTRDLKRRLERHNLGQSASTRPYRPWKLIYFEACTDEHDARRRERYLKTSEGMRFMKLRLKEYLHRTPSAAA